MSFFLYFDLNKKKFINQLGSENFHCNFSRPEILFAPEEYWVNQVMMLASNIGKVVLWKNLLNLTSQCVGSRILQMEHIRWCCL